MIKHLDADTHKLIQEWSGRYGYQPLPFEMWPKHSYVIGAEEKDVFIGSMYIDAENFIGFVAHMIVNPAADKNEREVCFSEFMNHFESVAKEIGLKCLFTTTNNASLIGRFESNGFTKCDTDVVHLVKGI